MLCLHLESPPADGLHPAVPFGAKHNAGLCPIASSAGSSLPKPGGERRGSVWLLVTLRNLKFFKQR